MKLTRRALLASLAAVATVIAVGFLFVYPGGRRIVGDYRLIKTGTDYQLQDTRQPENQLGNQGSVIHIGWDDHRIVVERTASPTTGTPWSNGAGWVVVNVDRHTTSPTMTEVQLKQRRDIGEIRIYTPDSAYGKGRWW